MDEKITNELKEFITSEGQKRLLLFPKFKKSLSKMISSNQSDVAFNVLKSALSIDYDYSTFKSYYNLVNKVRTYNLNKNINKTKIAILGSYTTNQLTWFIDLFLFCSDIDVEIYESEYSVINQEIYSKDSNLYRFKPQIVILICGHKDIKLFPKFGLSENDVKEIVDQEINRWMNLWNTLHTNINCQIIQNNFDIPPWNVMGNIEHRVPYSQGMYFTYLNQSLSKKAPAYVNIHDIDMLSSMHGKLEWCDQRFYYDSKLPCTPELLPSYANSIASIIVALLGKSKKCLVLDLDNTIWGGVIGDDGLGGISLGQGNPTGEAFLNFQQYIKNLKDRGIILAVCSKNDEKNAKEPFLRHPDMILKLDDITCFLANWNNKVANIQKIAQEINIGTDSIVFVDDNPHERGIVRYYLPEVAVPEMPEDPAFYIQKIDSYRYFETTSFTNEDLIRAELYSSDIKRKKLQNKIVNIDDYLQSLNMKAIVEPINPENINRSVQLINKTNQFNLTTKRYTKINIEEIINNSSWKTFTVRLIDNFGDNGLISIILSEIKNETLIIDTWLMSCRVLNRGVEQFLMNYICNLSRNNNISIIEGKYIPTAKNKMVEKLYFHLGFEQINDLNDGTTYWSLKTNSININNLKYFIMEGKKRDV
ncbi:MAG: HAD-IIIC family phosphatase [Spirochaetota bacterium]|nr:HAD-IIIC family phosphatase [Spirochaetota bacterium]